MFLGDGRKPRWTPTNLSSESPLWRSTIIPIFCSIRWLTKTTLYLAKKALLFCCHRLQCVLFHYKVNIQYKAFQKLVCRKFHYSTAVLRGASGQHCTAWKVPSVNCEWVADAQKKHSWERPPCLHEALLANLLNDCTPFCHCLYYENTNAPSGETLSPSPFFIEQ